MKKVLHISCVMLVIVLTSCSGQAPERDNSLMPLPPDSAAALQAPAPGSVPMVNSTTPQPATVALNPEHGQPGHRCDIAVGAPLNAPIASEPAVPVMQAPALPLQGNSNGAVTLNPPHGQPGHDCAIPVGQPLKS